MNADEARGVREALLNLRGSLLAEGPVEVRLESTGPVASDTDEDEAPFREMGQAIASARNRERVARLAAIEAALHRLEADPEGYGTCEGCGEPIAPRRLALLPFATHCVDCQSAADPRGRAVRRKVTDFR